MAVCTVPSPKDVAELFEGLLGKSVAGRKNEGASPMSEGPCVLAVYENAEGGIGAVVECDVALAAFGGAALSLIPKGMAEESIKSSRVADNLMENFAEVLNVGATLFVSPDSPRLKLREVVSHATELAEDVAAFRGGEITELNVSLDIESYGVGRFHAFLA